jgi:FMN reductase [NAD(P)H]
MRCGPTSSALQTYTVIFVQDPILKQTVQKHAGDQSYISEAPLFIVACADLRRVQNITKEREYPYRAHDLRVLISATEDLTIALQNASLAAQSLGLGTVMIGGVLNGASEINQLLNLPERVVPILGLCVGYAASNQQGLPPRPRLPREIVFHYDNYNLSEEDERALLQKHDRDVIDLGYYHNRHIPLSAVYAASPNDPVSDREYGWTEHVARKQSRQWWLGATPKLFHDLLKLGLDLTPPPSFQQRGEKRSKA